MHEVHGVLDAAKSITPGFSDSVPPRRDYGGDVVKVGNGFLSGDTEKYPALANALDERFAATGDFVHEPSPRITGGIDLRDITLASGRNAFDRYQELAGDPSGKKPLKDLLNHVVQEKGYKIAPHGKISETGTKEWMLEQYISQYHQAGLAKVMAEKTADGPTLRKVSMGRQLDLVHQRQVNAKDLRAASAQGGAQGLNRLLSPMGLTIPVPSASSIPDQQ
jgi:hypothetical protein